MNLICKNCGRIQKKVFFEEKKNQKKIQTCERCGSKNLSNKSTEIKLFWKCHNDSCNKYFKISETSAVQLMKNHEKPKCPFCSSEFTRPALKKEYQKFSGQMKKYHNTEAISLPGF